MSWRKGQPSGRGKKAAWSGGSPTQEAPRRRWQEPADTREINRARRRSSRNRWAITALMALALLSFLVWLLLQWNPKTPFVFVTVTKYEAPVPVNAWALEDRAALELLNGSNITVPKLPEWKADDNKFELLPASFHVNDYRRSAPVVIYVSAHGAVRDDGTPCILPSGASTNESKSWVPIKQLLEEIREKIPASRNTLLVLDCNRIRVDWNLGMVYNSFAEQVEALVNSRDWPGVAVLLSAGPGQVNWTSDDFRGTIFGRFFQLGLAGAADTKTVDGDVSLDELVEYLKREVSAWAVANRGEPQEPVLVPRDAKSFHVCYPIRGSSLPIRSTSLKDLTHAFEDAKSADNAELASAELEMWKQLDKLRELNLVRSDPAAWSNFEHQLLRLDELAHGGEAYAEDAKKLQADLREKLDKAVEAGKNTSGGSRKAEDYFGITRQATWMHKTDVGYSLPVCEYFGACTAEQSEQVRAAWKRLTDSRVNGTGDEIIDASKSAGVARDLVETQFLTAIRQQHVVSLWPNAIRLEDVQARRTAAEEASVPREPSGKPGDERAHYFARAAADKADPQRRLAEDLLFVGQRNAAKQYPKLARETDELNAWTSQTMQDASAAFRTRDEVYAVAPYLADWLCSPLSGAIQDRQQLITGRLAPLLQETAALNDALNGIEKLQDPEYLKPATPLPFHSQADRVRSEFEAIRARFDDKCKELAKKGKDDAAEWREREAALQTPIIPAAERDKLRTKQAELATELHHAFFEHENEPQHKEKEGEAESAHEKHNKEPSYLETAYQWKAHPLFEILRVATPEADSPVRWSTKANAEARRALGEHRNEKEKETDKVAAARHRLSDAETELRSKAALISKPLNEKSDGKDAVSELRQFDIQQLLIWNGQRAAAELWQNTVRTDSPTPFFARAAHAYLHAADGVVEPRLAAVADQVDHIERSIPKSEGFSVRPAAQVAPENEKAAIVSIAVGDDSDSSHFSSGVAALYLREGSQRLADLSVQTDPPGRPAYVNMSVIGKQPQHFHANISDTSAYNSAMKAVAFFRGREIATGFDLPVNNGIRIDYQPYVYKDQSITLVGDRRQRSHIDFVLDCSASMDEQTSIKGEVKGTNNTDKRLNLAKKQLTTMLDDLVARNNKDEEFFVGLILFGHRVGWTNGDPNLPMQVQAEYRSKEAELKRLGPSRDVDEAFPVGTFDDTVNEDMKNRINGLKPYGETPLYRALKLALERFTSEDQNSRKCIIAITDGKNNQTIPDTYARDVLEAWNKHKVPIYILGFDVAKDEAEQARQEYSALATATGGRYLTVSNGSELLSTLRQTLPIDLYSVLESGHPPTKLNESTPIDSAQLPKDYTVSYRAIEKTVRLEGGEAIALYMSNNGQDIVAKPYKPEIEPIILRGTTSRKPLQLRIHRPMRDKAHDAVQFSISLQVDPLTDHFTGRPLETWLEVTPLGDNSSEHQPYVFYDVNFEPQEPVPVLKWKALNWPKDATRAQIRFWCKYVPTTPAQAIPLRDLIGKTQSVAGVGLTAKTSNEGADYVVRIEEQHGPQSPGIYDFRIGFENELHEKPRHVIHQFDARRGIATHSYYFPGDLRESLERPQIARVVITSGKDLKDGALQLPPNGVVLPISAAGELFSPNATINGR